MARRDLGGHRQLRLRFRSGQAGRRRARDADDDAHRGDSAGRDEGRDAVGLAHLSRVPRPYRAAAQGRQRAALRAGQSVDGLRDGDRAVQDRPHADRRRASHDGPSAQRSDGRRRLRMVRAAPEARRAVSRAARLGRLADEHRRHARRDLQAFREGARRARRGLPGTDARELESQGRRASLRGAGENQRPPDHVRGGAVAGPLSASSSQHDSMARSLPHQRHSGLRPGNHDRGRTDLHLRGLESVRRLGFVARGHDRHDRGAQGEARRSFAAVTGSRPTCRAKDSSRASSIRSSSRR